jgi:acetylornithine deacetylase/succinyl-diaminopimelate desuccinylase-like protein
MKRWVLSCLLLAGAAARSVAAPPVQPVSAREATQWLQQYLRYDTTNPPGRERGAASWLAELINREGISARIFRTPSDRMSLWARLAPEPSRDGAPAKDLILLHHIDTVAPGDGWDVDPFGGTITDGRIVGRGAIDCKGLGIAHLAAFLDLHRRRVPLRRGVVFMAVADEEAGGGEGVGHLLNAEPDLFRDVEAVLNEGGGNRVVDGAVRWWGIEIAQKRPLWLEVSAEAVGGHAAGFRPHSAVHQLVRGLSRLIELPPRYRVSPVVRAILAAQAPYQNDFARTIYARVDEYVTPDGPTPGKGGWPPGLAAMLVDTLQVTVLEGAPQINSIPARAAARIDARLLPDTDPDAFLADLRTAAGGDLAIKVLLTEPPTPASPIDTRAYRELVAPLAAPGPAVPMMTSGFTDSRYFRRQRIPAYGFSPFRLEGEDGRGVHGPNESIGVEVFERGVEQMKALVVALAETR